MLNCYHNILTSVMSSNVSDSFFSVFSDIFRYTNTFPLKYKIA